MKFGALSYIRRVSLFLGLIQALKLSETAQCWAVLCLMTLSFSIFRVSEFCFDFQGWLDLIEQLKKCAKFKYFNSMPNFLWHSDFFSSLSPIFSSVLSSIRDYPMKVYACCSHCPMATLYWKSKTHSQFLDIWCIFDRQTAFHLEDCPKPMSFFVNPV